jgi:DNA-binding NtrC family response regulator
LERAAILCQGGLILADHLGLRDGHEEAPRPAPAPPAPALASALTPTPVEFEAAMPIQSMERAMIERALRDTRYNKSKAARQLGLTRTQLYVRLKRYGLE